MNARCYIVLAAATAALFLFGVPAALAATFTVDRPGAGLGDTSPGDGICEDGVEGTDCTFRAAVEEANANAFSDTIAFSPAIGEPVQPNNTLTITQPVTLNGCPVDPNHAGPCTELRLAGGNIAILNVAAPGVTVRGLALNTSTSAKLTGTAAADNLTLKNNWFGIALDGTPTSRATGTAIEVLGDNATIGGTAGATGSSPADRNVISNTATGIVLAGDNAVVQGNFIGTNPTGAPGLFNGHGNNGVGTAIRIADLTNVHQPNNNLIGGTVAPAQASTSNCDGACNVIANASSFGITLDETSLSSLTTFANATTIRGNYIGTDVTGSADVGNGTAIRVGRGDSTQIGGVATGDRNLIAGSSGASPLDGDGIGIVGGDNTSIIGNTFGRGAGGQAIPNTGVAISAVRFSPADSAVDGQIGGDTASSENLISNSGADAIELHLGTDDFTIARNTGAGNGSGEAGDEFIDLTSASVNSGVAAPAITSAQRSAVSGSATPGAAKTIRIFTANAEHGSIGTFLGSATTAPNGNWTFAYSAQLPVGQRITATMTDPGTGNDTSELAKPVRTGFDGTNPTVFFESGPQGNETITDSTPTFEFSSNFSNATFECRFEPNAFTACSSPFTPSLSDGPHLFAVRARVGASVSQAAGSSFTVDATAETAIESGPAGPTSDSTPQFGFSSPDAGATFKCRFDAAPFGPCSGPGNSHGPAAPLTDGPHAFKVKATDPLGNVDQTPAVRNFVVDTVDPEGTITTGPAAGSKTKDTTPTFGFSSNETGSTFECKLDTAAFGPCSGPGLKHTTATLGDGQHTFRVRATDAAGNADPVPAARNFIIDTVRPDTTITSGPAAGSTTVDATPTFGFSSNESGATFECRVDGGSFGPCSGPGAKHTPATLADGQHTFRVRAIDGAGNIDDTPVVRTFRVDAP